MSTTVGSYLQNPYVKNAEMGIGLAATLHGLQTLYVHKKACDTALQSIAELKKKETAGTVPMQAAYGPIVPTLSTSKQLTIALEVFGGAALILHGYKS